jgi:hypothetical protein
MDVLGEGDVLIPDLDSEAEDAQVNHYILCMAESIN